MLYETLQSLCLNHKIASLFTVLIQSIVITHSPQFYQRHSHISLDQHRCAKAMQQSMLTRLALSGSNLRPTKIPNHIVTVEVFEHNYKPKHLLISNMSTIFKDCFGSLEATSQACVQRMQV